MGYLNNNTRVSSVRINGVNQTNYLVQFTCSDASANKNGLVSTVGQVRLAGYGESPSMEDYDRDNFRRGQQVIIEITLPSGSIVRHPRGLLYVLSTSYEPEADELVVEVGCRLALAALTEDVSEILSLVPVPLDPAQQTYQNISASFAAAGKYLFQDNQGNLVENYFFGTDSTNSIEPGEWVSVYGVTTQAAQPLAGTSPIPDQIELSYQVPSDALTSNQSGKVEITETESRYFLSYPATMFVRKPIENGPKPPDPSPTRNAGGGGCGNSPDIPDTGLPASGPSSSPTPGGGQINSCSEGYETKQQTTYVPAYRQETQRTEYTGPGGQVGRVYSEVRGPAYEVNGQYYADKMAFCRASRGTACNPNGGCSMDGLGNILQSYSEQLNYYGSANELIKTVTDNYETTLSGAVPSDYRSGEVNGEGTTWRDLSTSDMYRVSRVEVVYNYKKNQTIQDTYTWTSSTSRGSGIRAASIDALSGIKTSQRRISTTITANPISPDIVNTVTTSTTERSTKILLSDQYITPPGVAGPYVLKEQVPVPVLFNDETQIKAIVDSYSSYLNRFVRGDAYGISLTESMREEIVSNWRPGMPFRYHDPRSNRILAMRMDACAWGLDAENAVVATNGIWVGFSNGTMSVPSNLVGNSRPNMGSGGGPAPGAGTPPSVNNETAVNSGNYAWDVNVDIGLSLDMAFWGETGVHPILPTDTNYEFSSTLTVWCAGLIVNAGFLVDTDGNGGIPLEYGGNLVINGATIIDGDVFA
ncbi:unknown structural protein [Synechococcus phage S-CBS2]|uniref:unknown structural protein n=1 Tax=Synechococcus phage S-CBS2 TaxID=753084 RepID=UPI00020783F1|nr:unknown structural protein [Synechococcus phage S-CBS2]ADF42380.1 unknown structural protein [Synechococcus phage S-CBS2]